MLLNYSQFKITLKLKSQPLDLKKKNFNFKRFVDIRYVRNFEDQL